MSDLRQIRSQVTLGGLTIYGGVQLEPNKKLIVGHAHEVPHLIIFLYPDEGPRPQYKLYGETKDGLREIPMGPFGFAYVKAGVVHWAEQCNPEAVGGFVCIFPAYDATGKLEDPMKAVYPGPAT